MFFDKQTACRLSRRALVRGALGLGLLLSLPAWAVPRVLVLNNTNKPPYSTDAHTGYADLIATEAFRRIGTELRLIVLPPERGLLNANAGIEDGDMVRIAGLDTQYPNLIRVPEKLMDWEFVAFSKDPALAMDWPAIRSRAVGHIKGWKIYEQQLAGAAHVTTAVDDEQLFRLLDAGRVDTVLYERWLGLALIKARGLQGIRTHQPPLATREMFIYLHKRHAALAPKLAEALRALKQEGFYQQAYRRTLLPYIDTPTR
ncbi:MAG: transporter substrate-binding domain-containing protein [Betaproteobacteria bacterium]|nr:transporter substrate-binding domain-containing protein [Betaproteobacteria bacterium]